MASDLSADLVNDPEPGSGVYNLTYIHLQTTAKNNMTRFFLLLIFLLVCPLAAQATDAPAGQIQINANQVLRGRFVEERQVKITDNPIETSGHFVAAPARGLIWSIEKPFPTSTIVTPNGAAQDIGGLALKLPAKNLPHLYAMVSAALSGDWSGLENEFTITRSGNAMHWQLLLTPRPNENLKQTYAAIAVSGGYFVENIVMTKTNNTYDSIGFSEEALSSQPLTANEVYAFNEVKP
jgi:hypothetical protein